MDKISEARVDLMREARALLGQSSIPGSSQIFDSVTFVRHVLGKLGNHLTRLKWNQAFLYDFLPGEIQAGQVKPGDLVFWSGDYWNPRKRVPPHKIVHVELATGTGEGSIGVRNGLIEEFDGVVYPSLSFKTIKVHYKSIDVWLRGQFKCHCKQHDWMGKSAESIQFRQTVEDPMYWELKAWKNFFLGTGNNNRLVKQELMKEGWTQSVVNNSKLIRFLWTQTLKDTAKLNVQEGRQLSNHISGIHNVFTSKRSLAHLVRTIPHFPAPLGFDLADDRDLQEFLSLPSTGTWILKPHALNQGIGISLVRNVQEFKQKIKKGEESRNKVIQMYLEPLLLDGYKFDIRFYTAIVRCKPLIVLAYPEYYIRRSLIKYESDSQDLLAHLTNAHQQKSHPDFDSRKEESIISRKELGTHLGPQLTEKMERGMIAASTSLFQAAAIPLEKRWGSFELLGLDFMLDRDSKLFFIEANTNPALFTDTTVQQDLIPEMIKQLIQIVLRVHDDDLNFLRDTQFRLLYSEVSTN